MYDPCCTRLSTFRWRYAILNLIPNDTEARKYSPRSQKRNRVGGAHGLSRKVQLVSIGHSRVDPNDILREISTETVGGRNEMRGRHFMQITKKII